MVTEKQPAVRLLDREVVDVKSHGPWFEFFLKWRGGGMQRSPLRGHVT